MLHPWSNKPFIFLSVCTHRQNCLCLERICLQVTDICALVHWLYGCMGCIGADKTVLQLCGYLQGQMQVIQIIYQKPLHHKHESHQVTKDLFIVGNVPLSETFLKMLSAFTTLAAWQLIALQKAISHSPISPPFQKQINFLCSLSVSPEWNSIP